MKNQKNHFYTNFIPKEEVVLQVKKCSKQFILSFSDKLISSNDLLRASIADGAGYVNYIAKLNNWPEFVRKIFLQCFFTSENSVKSSGNISVYFFACKMLNKEALNLQDIIVEKSNIHKSFCSLSEFIDLNIFEFVKSTIENLGIKGNLNIKKTHSTIPALELKSCHMFNLGLLGGFSSEVEHREEAKIVLYDGSIQDMGQIDRLFNECHEQKTTCILIARSYSNDVASTINANYLRKTLDVIPIVVDDQIENINILGDISICAASDLITAESGVRLSNISVSDLTTITNIKISHKTFCFDQKEEAKFLIEKRTKNILKKIESAFWADDMSKEDIEIIYGKRLDALNASSVILWANGEDSFIQYLNNIFSFSINYMAAFANSGTVNIDIPAIKSNYTLPANIVDVSNVISEKMYTAICSSGGCVAIQ